MLNPSPSPFDVWIAAVSSGYLTRQGIAAWADQRILNEPDPPPYLYDLSLARTSVEAEQILYTEWVRQLESNVKGTPTFRKPGELHVGFLYLQYAEGRLAMSELLDRAGRYADGPGYGHIDDDCEAFFLLLNEIDGGGPTIPSDRPLADRVAELFAPYNDAASIALQKIQLGPEQR